MDNLGGASPNPNRGDGSLLSKAPCGAALCPVAGFLASGLVVLTSWRLNNGVWSLLEKFKEKYKKKYCLWSVSNIGHIDYVIVT